MGLTFTVDNDDPVTITTVDGDGNESEETVSKSLNPMIANQKAFIPSDGGYIILKFPVLQVTPTEGPDGSYVVEVEQPPSDTVSVKLTPSSDTEIKGLVVHVCAEGKKEFLFHKL